LKLGHTNGKMRFLGHGVIVIQSITLVQATRQTAYFVSKLLQTRRIPTMSLA
jgi:hypothetical protein